jgi:hypothetical protein
MEFLIVHYVILSLLVFQVQTFFLTFFTQTSCISIFLMVTDEVSFALIQNHKQIKYLVAVYLTTLSVSRPTYHRVTGSLINSAFGRM